jgi:hypothetical protein
MRNCVKGRCASGGLVTISYTNNSGTRTHRQIFRSQDDNEWKMTAMKARGQLVSLGDKPITEALKIIKRDNSEIVLLGVRV